MPDFTDLERTKSQTTSRFAIEIDPVWVSPGALE
jgi:hypothetical protein